MCHCLSVAHSGNQGMPVAVVSPLKSKKICMESASFVMKINRKCCKKVLHLKSVSNKILHIMSSLFLARYSRSVPSSIPLC